MSKRDYQAALFMGAATGNDECVVTCIDEYMVDVNCTDHDGDTALYWASSRQNNSTAKLLLSRGADPNILGASGSCLRAAAALGNIELAELLIKFGAIVDSDLHLGTPLNMALKGRHFDVVELLLSKGASADQASGNMNETPLMGACLLGRLDLVKLFISYGADVNRKDRDGDTALAYLALGRTNNTQIAVELIQRGANIDDLYSHGSFFLGSSPYNGDIAPLTKAEAKNAVQVNAPVSLAYGSPEMEAHLVRSGILN